VRTLLGMLQLVVGLLSVLAAAWSFLASFGTAQSLRLLWHAGGYQPATFTVEELEYSDDPETRGFWAKGRVQGAVETLTLRRILPRRPKSHGDLLTLAPVGATFQVLYNPAASQDSIEGEFARVVPYDADLGGTQRRTLRRRLHRAYTPLVVVAPLAVAVWALLRRHLGPLATQEPKDAIDALLSPSVGSLCLIFTGAAVAFGVLVQTFLVFVV
jgi:hypothetical protein